MIGTLPGMLIRMFKALGRSATRPGNRDSSTEVLERINDSPPQRMDRLNRAHGAAAVDLHLDILYGGLRIGSHRLLDLVQSCLADSDTAMPPAKAFHRPLASYFLAHYFLHALGVEGERAECGVFHGTSALLLCRAAQSRDPAYAGAGFHLIDSFEGLDEPTDEDRFDVPRADGEVTSLSIKKGSFAAPMEKVRASLGHFPKVTYHKGWIPNVLDALTPSPWSFVHLDVDHYEPTYSSLAYFYPRLSRGGVIICDDYGAPMFPGAHRAWDRFCDEQQVPYVVLDTGQSVILKS